MDSAPTSELGRAGQIVAGKFRLETVIGRGGMGSVWSATHVGLGHRVALKLIAREYVRSPEALRRFEAEAKAAARLQSRHVVQVFDNGTLDDGTPFIAMELLSGENVSERIARAGPFGLASTVEIIAQCCKALGRAHAAGIVHRDIKPDNVYLAREPDEDADVAKILDFGVAKIALALEPGSQVTGTGALLGTPLYMSPEQIRGGARDVDHRADLYSLGLVAYTMLTGKVAISGDSFGDLLLKICTQPLPSLIAAVPSLPHAMEAWFQRACAREPGDRYPSAQELGDSLRAASATAPSNVSPFGQSAALGPTLAAPVVNTPPAWPQSPSAPALPQSPSAPGWPQSPSAPGWPQSPSFAVSQGVPPVFSQSASLAGSQGIAPLFSQSGAAVSLTAAGIPRRQTGALVAMGAFAGVLVLGVAVLLAILLRRSDSAPPIDPSAAGHPAPSSVSIPVPPPVLAPSVVPAVAPDDAAGPAASTPPAKPRVPEALPATPPHLPTVPPTVRPPPQSAPAHSSRPPIVVGY